METRERRITCIPAQAEITSHSRRNIGQNKKRVAAYCRVSTEEEEQQSSFENQISYYTQLINGNPEWTMVGIFADEGISGTQTKKRVEFLKLMQLCEEGKVDVVLVKSISRFARNTLDTLNYVRKLKDKNIAVIFEKENINTLDISSEMILTLYSSFAQAEVESISKNITWSIRKQYKEGKVRNCGAHLLGYNIDENGELVIHSEEAKIVRWIYYAYLAGLSYWQIKKHLEKQGIKTVRGNDTWGVSTIKNILTNEKYMGDVLLQKTFTENVLEHKRKKNTGELPQYYITDHHTGIVSKEIWYLVKAEMARRNTITNKDTVKQIKKGHYSSKYALSELIFCGECGTAYRRVTWARNGKKKIVWRCVNRLEYGKEYCKHSPSLEEEALQNAILWAINQYIKDKDELKRCLRESIGITRQTESEETTNELDKKIEILEEAIIDLSELLGASSAELDYFDKKFEELENRLKELYAKKQSSQIERDLKLDFSKEDETLIDIVEKDGLDLKKYNDMLVRRIIKEITVIKQDKIKVVFMDDRKVEVLV